jgi:hypothetical protein
MVMGSIERKKINILTLLFSEKNEIKLPIITTTKGKIVVN